MDEQLDPGVRRLWYLQAVATAVFVGALLLVVLGIVELNASVPGWIWAVAGVAVAGVLIAGVGYAPLAYRTWRYRLSPEALELRRGVAWRHASSLPYHRIQQIDVSQGPLERHFGIVTLRLRSAAATTDASLPGLHADVADTLRRTLLARAGVDDGA